MLGKVLFISGWAIFTILVGYLLFRKIAKDSKSISFEETFNKTGLPVISLYNDSNQLNFLLDTGSDCCVINSKELKYLHYTDIRKKVNTVDSSGINQRNIIRMALDDGNNIVHCRFVVMDLSAQFNEIYNKDKVRIHGILGSKFCKAAGLIIDFNKLRVY